MRQLACMMICIWVVHRIFLAAIPVNPASGLAALLMLFTPVVFGLVHGTRRYGFATSLVFFLAALFISNLLENLSVNTGFPFGFYTHSADMGPKLLAVPLVVGPGYFGICYLAWILAHALMGDAAAPSAPLSRFGQPVLAAFIAVGADLCGDPIGSTLGHHWTYLHGGAYFGVPVLNYFGWFLTTWTIFQIFAFYLARFQIRQRPVSAMFWYEAAAFWGVMAGSILAAAAITAIYAMLPVSVAGALAVAGRERPRNAVAERSNGAGQVTGLAALKSHID